jgi:hypothetical protein
MMSQTRWLQQRLLENQRELRMVRGVDRDELRRWVFSAA